MAKNLIIYYSRRGQNYVNGSVQTLARGNAELITEYIEKAVGADVFEIDTVKPYSTDYKTCTEEALAEVRANTRPELKKYLDNIDGYDNIFVVGPNWWGIYPMAIYTQLERLDFDGKRVHFVVTHEGSGFGSVPKTMKDSCKGARLGESLAVQGGKTVQAEKTVAGWAKKAVSAD